MCWFKSSRPNHFPHRPCHLVARMKEIDEAYLHISQGGITFAVVDKGMGPTIQISLSNMGHSQVIEVFTNADSLAAIGEMFLEASKHRGYSAPYCEAARFMDINFHRVTRSVGRLRDEGKHEEADALMAEASRLRAAEEGALSKCLCSEDIKPLSSKVSTP